MRALVLFLLLLVPALASCGSSNDAADGTTVVAAFYPLAWAAEQIAGKGVDVVNLTPPGSEPHDIELSPRDIEAIDGAHLVLYLGAGFMPALEDAVRGHDNAVDLLEGERLRSSAGEPESGVDPHVWLDPLRYAHIVEKVGAALGRPAPARRLATRLEGLDAEYRNGLAHCTRREIVTSHAAFGYLAHAYGLEQVALLGLSPEAEPSPRTLEALVDEVEKQGVTTVFSEKLVSPKLAQTIAREAGVRTAVLDPIEGLDDDEVAAGDDYFTVMQRNLVALREALGCR